MRYLQFSGVTAGTGTGTAAAAAVGGTFAEYAAAVCVAAASTAAAAAAAAAGAGAGVGTGADLAAVAHVVAVGVASCFYDFLRWFLAQVYLLVIASLLLFCPCYGSAVLRHYPSEC